MHLRWVTLVVVKFRIRAFDVVYVLTTVVLNDARTQEQVYWLVVIRVKSHESFRVHESFDDLIRVSYIEEVVVKHELKLILFEKQHHLVEWVALHFGLDVFAARKEQNLDISEFFSEKVTFE